MASISKQPGRMSFRLDTGELSGSKTVYKTVSIGAVRPDADVNGLAAVASAFGAVISGVVDRVSLHHAEYLSY